MSRLCARLRMCGSGPDRRWFPFLQEEEGEPRMDDPDDVPWLANFLGWTADHVEEVEARRKVAGPRGLDAMGEETRKRKKRPSDKADGDDDDDDDDDPESDLQKGTCFP